MASPLAPGPPLPPPPPLPAPAAATLRLGTFNLGLSFMRKVPHILTRCAALQLDAVALQEIGNPALLSNRLHPYTFISEAGPSCHCAGVGLLLSLALSSRIRSYKRSGTGRLVGAVLELSKGHLTLVVSVYMPTGLDHHAASSSEHEEAHEIYAKLVRWSVGMHQVVVMGDLNETLTPWDRLPHPPAAAARAAAHSPISRLPHEGFLDCYRSMHASAALDPGFTHTIAGARPSQSRIDYVWVKGISPASLLQVRIDGALNVLSHHHLLWVEVQLAHAAPAAVTTPLLRLRLPNLRAATEAHTDTFIKRVEHRVREDQEPLQALTHVADAASLDRLASRLTGITHRAAVTSLPITGAAAYKSSDMLQLQAQRRALTNLTRVSTTLLHSVAPERMHSFRFTHCEEWRRQYRLCVEQHQLHWSVDALDNGDPEAWMQETQRLQAVTRAAIRKEQRRMQRQPRASLDVSPAALVHRMLESDALPTHLHSVVDKHGSLTTNVGELEAVMVEHFQSVFALPSEPVAPLPLPPPPILFDKSSVQPEWYDGLMADVSAQEILDTLADAPLVSAPGQDEVSTGLWKIALHGSSDLCALVAALFTGCLHSSTFPSAWKTSVIVPLLKDALKERNMSNVRPISLQSCLGKLLNKILAHRLGKIFSSHPILHPAQRGFINGGSITKSIDELLDAWDWSRADNREMYTLFYDIKQAYDSVQASVLVRALHRLRMPHAFVDLIADSLTGLQSCVRTAYGVSQPFEVRRSLRQGDPLAPLLFVVLMDALHEGLECNPFTNERHGLELDLQGGQTASIPSLGYADDTATLTNSLAAMRVQNEWVHYFMAFNHLRLNHTKCELVGRKAGGGPVSAADLAAEVIEIEGNAVQPVAHDKAIRYLGVHCRLDGSWKDQHDKSLAMVRTFTGVVDKFSLSLNQAAYMFNVFLLPKLELALRYVHGPGTNGFVSNCDAAIIGCIKHAVASPLRLSHSAVALALHINLPSWIEATAKVSELFLRMNSTQCRWGRLGRILMRKILPSGLADGAVRLPHANSGTRLSRAARLAVDRLGWTLQLHQQRRAGGRSQHLFSVEPAGSLPDGSLCSVSQDLQLSTGPIKVAHDLWQSWGATAPALPGRVHVYTDGSYDATSSPHSTSAWAITVADRWFDSNFGGIPADEHLLQAAHVRGASLFGASINCTRGVYAAELQAIARALAMFPASCELEIHSDSQGALAGIRAYETQLNERRRLRMSSRPLLQLIHHLLQRRAGVTHTSHVKAHTSNSDCHSVGNRLTDFQANLARSKPDKPTPLCLRELPLQQCEHHMFMLDEQGVVLCDDIRRAALARLKSTAMAKWMDRTDGRGDLAGPAMIDFGRAVLQDGSIAQQTTFVHVATNSIEFFWPAGSVGNDQLKRLQCAQCNQVLTLLHLAECPAPPCLQFRIRLNSDIRNILATDACTRGWLLANSRLMLSELLFSLFPLAATATAQERLRHLTCLLVGAFTDRQANAAAKRLGFPTAEAGRSCLLQLRLRCLESIHRIYSSWKETAGA